MTTFDVSASLPIIQSLPRHADTLSQFGRRCFQDGANVCNILCRTCRDICRFDFTALILASILESVAGLTQLADLLSKYFTGTKTKHDREWHPQDGARITCVW